MATAFAYTVSEVSELSGIPKSTLYEQVREGRCSELRPIRCGTTTSLSWGSQWRKR